MACFAYVWISLAGLPEIFKLGPSWHGGTALLSARFTDNAIDEIDPIEEFDTLSSVILNLSISFLMSSLCFLQVLPWCPAQWVSRCNTTSALIQQCKISKLVKLHLIEHIFIDVCFNKDYQRMMVDPIFMIVQSLRSFLTAVTPTVVAPIAVILPLFSWIHLNLPEITWTYLNLPELNLKLPEFTWITWIYPNLHKYTWLYMNLPDFTCIYLNLPKFTWIYLNLPEYIWIYMN